MAELLKQEKEKNEQRQSFTQRELEDSFRKI